MAERFWRTRMFLTSVIGFTITSVLCGASQSLDQIGPILGPILGGWLTAHYSWRWVFYVNVPFGILTAIGLSIFLKETPAKRTSKLDWLGFSALSIAIGAFQLMLDRGEQLDWLSLPEIIVEAILACLGLYIFVVQSLLAPQPFLPPP